MMRFNNISIRRLVVFLFLTVIMGISLISCDHKELCFHHDHLITLTLRYDWCDAPDAEVAAMVAFFYPTDPDSGNIYRFIFPNSEGGEIEVAEGTYHLLTYNADSELVIAMQTDDYFTHLLYTRLGWLFEPAMGSRSTRSHRNDGIPRSEGAEDEAVVVTPDQMWGFNVVDIEVTKQGVFYECNPFDPDYEPDVDIEVTENTITVYPHDLMCHYSYEVRNVKGLDNVLNLCGAITGMSATLDMSSEEPDSKSVTYPVEATISDDTTITGEFLCFGHHSENDYPHFFSLYLWLRGGETVFIGNLDNFDVSDQIHAAEDPRNVHFIIDGLDLTQFHGGESSWDVKFDDWIDNEEEMIMGGKK